MSDVLTCSSILCTSTMVGLSDGSGSRHFSAIRNTRITSSIGYHAKALSIACCSLFTSITPFTYRSMNHKGKHAYKKTTQFYGKVLLTQVTSFVPSSINDSSDGLFPVKSSSKTTPKL